MILDEGQLCRVEFVWSRWLVDFGWFTICAFAFDSAKRLGFGLRACAAQVQLIGRALLGDPVFPLRRAKKLKAVAAVTVRTSFCRGVEVVGVFTQSGCQC